MGSSSLLLLDSEDILGFSIFKLSGFFPLLVNFFSGRHTAFLYVGLIFSVFVSAVIWVMLVNMFIIVLQRRFLPFGKGLFSFKALASLRGLSLIAGRGPEWDQGGENYFWSRTIHLPLKQASTVLGAKNCKKEMVNNWASEQSSQDMACSFSFSVQFEDVFRIIRVLWINFTKAKQKS